MSIDGGRVDPRDVPSYPLGLAAWYLQINSRTLKGWVAGWPYTTTDGVAHFSDPLIRLPEDSEGDLSFWNMVEAYVLRRLRREHRIIMAKIREALDDVSSTLGVERPLIHESLSDGIDLLVNHEGVLRVASRKRRQLVMDGIRPFLRRIRWEHDELADTLCPLLRRREDADAPEYVVIRAGFASGRPVVQGSAAPVTTIAERFYAGESIGDLMADYGIGDWEMVQEALRWHRGAKRAA